MAKNKNKRQAPSVQEKKTNSNDSGSRKNDADGANLQDWISKLAESNVHADTTLSNKNKNNKKNSVAAPVVVVNSKEERKLRREAKKARRKERIEQKQQARDNKKRAVKDSSEEQTTQEQYQSIRELQACQRRLDHMNQMIGEWMDENNSKSMARERRFMGTNKILHAKRRWDDDGIQPRPRDYGGIGLARKSLFLDFDDPSFFPKLEQEFAEHVPGFFGKQRTKAMKKQLNANMLWKRMLDDKQQQQNEDGTKKKKKRKIAMQSAEERAEFMMQEGLV